MYRLSSSLLPDASPKMTKFIGITVLSSRYQLNSRKTILAPFNAHYRVTTTSNLPSKLAQVETIQGRFNRPVRPNGMGSRCVPKVSVRHASCVCDQFELVLTQPQRKCPHVARMLAGRLFRTHRP
ncbi:hypothetical protein I7I48_00199 [Histoplasma ohiense]|nr:hypothetical protein I7I48_00199 [Histoplasma ohiense (nom. inval.)]